MGIGIIEKITGHEFGLDPDRIYSFKFNAVDTAWAPEFKRFNISTDPGINCNHRLNYN